MADTISRIKKTDTVVPNSIGEANVLLGKLGKTQDAINKIEATLKEKIAKLKEDALKKLEPLIIDRDKKVNALFTFAHPRKEELTKEVKSIVLATGTFGWRLTPPSVQSYMNDEEIIQLLKNTGNSKFVRIIEEVNRHLLLEEKPVIAGINYSQSDEFFVVPKQARKKPKILTHAIDR